ncbi:MAG: bile acid:sodium symporter family protein [Fimbriimonadales bacterium]
MNPAFMEQNIFTAVILPIALAVIMLGLGMGLTPADFARIFVFPKAALIGLICQMALLPIVGIGLAHLFPMEPALKVGLMILAVCPAGASANLFTYLSRGDVALAVTLTAFNSVLIVFTAPILINLSLLYFMGEGREIQLPVGRTILQVALITLLPISLGMLIRRFAPAFCERIEAPVRILSFLFLAVAVLGATLQVRENLPSYFRQVGPPMLTLNVLTMGLGYGAGRLLGLPRQQNITIAIEGGIQNGTLAIFIASTLLQAPAMSIPPAVYSLIMFATGGYMIYRFGRHMK